MASAQTSIESFAKDFARVSAALPGADAPWLVELRRDALEALSTGGLPSVRDEDWKYTSILPVLRDRLEPVLPSEILVDDAALRPLLERAVGIDAGDELLVFVDGSLRPSLSRSTKTRGLRTSSLRERLNTEAAALEPLLGKYLPPSVHGFAALNTAFLDDGAVVEIGAGAQLDAPVHLVCLSTSRESPYVSHPRHLVVAGEGSSAVVVEHYIGAEGARYLTNAASEVVLARGAVLGHLRVQDEARSAFHISRVQVAQSPSSTLLSHAFGFGAALSRTEIAVCLDGEEAECRLAGLYLSDASRHIDHHLSVDHAKPRTRSEQLYKGVLEDKSRGVFTGRVLVRVGSQKIKATQRNPSLLLGAGAVSETRPQLEIHADDVACNHGATIGRLSDDALFYLLSRGIDEKEARRILVSGFATEVVGSVVPERLRNALQDVVGRQVGALGSAARPVRSDA